MAASNNFGLNNDFEYIELALDSLDATNAKTSGVTTLNWPVFEFTRNLSDVVAIKVLDVAVPVSFYAITDANGSFVLAETGAPMGIIMLPPGNYMPNTLANTLATLLSASSPSHYAYVVNYSAQTGNLAIVNSSTGPFSLIFGGPNDTGNTNPRQMLGFGPGINASTRLGLFDTLITGSIQTMPSYLYLNSTTLGYMINLYIPQGARNLAVGEVGAQIAKIPISANANDVLMYTDPDPQKWFPLANLASFTSIDMYFTLGNTNHVMDFNGQPFSVKLGLLVRNNNATVSQGATFAQGRVRSRISPQ